MVTLEELARKEYQIEYEGATYTLRPTKVWTLQPRGRKGIVVGLFKLPNGKTVRRVIAKVSETGEIIPA